MRPLYGNETSQARIHAESLREVEPDLLPLCISYTAPGKFSSGFSESMPFVLPTMGFRPGHGVRMSHTHALSAAGYHGV